MSNLKEHWHPKLHSFKIVEVGYSAIMYSVLWICLHVVALHWEQFLNPTRPFEGVACVIPLIWPGAGASNRALPSPLCATEARSEGLPERVRTRAVQAQNLRGSGPPTWSPPYARVWYGVRRPECGWTKNKPVKLILTTCPRSSQATLYCYWLNRMIYTYFSSAG